MTIEEYRQLGTIERRDENFQFVHPPCVPHEVFVLWTRRNPEKVTIKKGYEPEKKRSFEDKMAGIKDIPAMPAPIVAAETKTLPLSSVAGGGRGGGSGGTKSSGRGKGKGGTAATSSASSGTKRPRKASKRNVFTILD